MTKENDPKPSTSEPTPAASTPKLFERLKLPANWRDVTSEKSGTTFALIGPPQRRQALSDRQRKLVRQVMAAHPALTLDEALRMLNDAGM
jgi:hypothetical protein